jgi:hypothetical protein
MSSHDEGALVEPELMSLERRLLSELVLNKPFFAVNGAVQGICNRIEC